MRRPLESKDADLAQTGKGHPMLILTRRIGETVVIGDNVTVTVLGVKGNQIRVGIEAPKEVSVHRMEIVERNRMEAQIDEMSYSSK